MEIIAHRGASFDAPENTLAAFRLGWAETQTVELDIWPTADGKLLVIHDGNAKRTTGLDHQVFNRSLEELQQLDAGSFKGARWSGERLPSLREVLAVIPSGKKLLIEIKTGPEMVEELWREVEISGKADQILIQSFNCLACAEAKKLFPRTEVNLLAEWQFEAPTTGQKDVLTELIHQAKGAHLDGLSLENKPDLGAETIRRIHDAGLKASFWTVDDPARARTLIEAGADAIITNRPGWMLGQLGERAATSKLPGGA